MGASGARSELSAQPGTRLLVTAEVENALARPGRVGRGRKWQRNGCPCNWRSINDGMGGMGGIDGSISVDLARIMLRDAGLPHCAAAYIGL